MLGPPRNSVARQSPDRHHLAPAAPHVQPGDVLRPLPEARLRLRLHPVGLPVQVEVVDVQRGQHRLQRLEEIVERHPARLGRFAVHLEVDLRHVGPEGGLHTGQLRQLVGVLHEALHRARELRERLSAAGLQIHLQAAGGAESRDLREVERKGERLLHGEELAVRPAHDGFERHVRRGALIPFLEIDEDDGAVGLGRERERVHADQRAHVRHALVLHQPLLDLAHHRLGALLRGAIGQLHRDGEEALVLRRDERLRRPLVEHEGQRENRREDGDRRPRAAEDPAHPSDVAVGNLAEDRVEPAEEPVGRMIRRGLFLEQQSAERRGQRQRDDARDHHRQHDGHRELLVHLPGDAAEKGDRDEYRAEHQHDRDQRPAHLTDGAVSRHPGRHLLLGHDPFDVLDHHDRVVHHDADGQHQAEQRQHVDREAEHQQARGRSRSPRPAPPAPG